MITSRYVLLVLIAAATICVGKVAAQEKGYGAIGTSFTTGFGYGYTNCGFGAKLQYNGLNPVRIEGSVTAFVRNDNLSMTDAALNLHWLAFINDKICLYPLAGGGYTINRIWMKGDLEDKYTSKAFGNIGGGVDFYLTDVIVLNFEAKYKYIEKASRYNLSAGIAYLF